MSARSVADKILAIVFPITAFVASGFEHSIANMYFIPMGLLLKGEPQVIAAAAKRAADLANLNLPGLLGNLLSVTTGNIFGGGFMVAAVYWFVYLCPREVRGRGVPKRILGLFLTSLGIERSKEQE
jgi:formate/nitrite transporter FocA (FNT family)